MLKKVILLCCLALAYSASLGPDYSPAISYSSIRFGSSSIEKDSSSWLSEKPQITNESPIYYRTLESVNSRNIDDANTASIYTEAIVQNAPLKSQDPAKPVLASRNIPLSPSPEFAKVPSVLKTEGLSAYASFPLKTVVPKVYSAPVKAVPTYQKLPKSGLAQGSVSAPVYLKAVRKNEGFVVGKEAQVGYSEPAVFHVKVSSVGTNYSW